MCVLVTLPCSRKRVMKSFSPRSRGYAIWNCNIINMNIILEGHFNLLQPGPDGPCRSFVPVYRFMRNRLLPRVFFTITTHTTSLVLSHFLCFSWSLLRAVPHYSYLQVTSVFNLPSLSPNDRVKTCLFLEGKEKGRGCSLPCPLRQSHPMSCTCHAKLYCRRKKGGKRG